MIQALAAAAAVLLAAAGAGKLRSPAPAVAMLVNGWPALRRRRAALTHAVRAGGIAELAVAVAVLPTAGGPRTRCSRSPIWCSSVSCWGC